MNLSHIYKDKSIKRLINFKKKKNSCRNDDQKTILFR